MNRFTGASHFHHQKIMAVPKRNLLREVEKLRGAAGVRSEETRRR